MTDTAIYVNFEKQMIPIEALYTDSNGIYVSLEDLLISGRMWECDFCHKYNPDYRTTCMACGKDRYDQW